MTIWIRTNERIYFRLILQVILNSYEKKELFFYSFMSPFRNQKVGNYLSTKVVYELLKRFSSALNVPVYLAEKFSEINEMPGDDSILFWKNKVSK
jgi:hypothetical protein